LETVIYTKITALKYRSPAPRTDQLSLNFLHSLKCSIQSTTSTDRHRSLWLCHCVGQHSSQRTFIQTLAHGYNRSIRVVFPRLFEH